MPARPEEHSGEVQAPNGPGKMRWKMYTIKAGDDVLVFRQQIFPGVLPQNTAARGVEFGLEKAGAGKIEIVKKTPVNIQGVKGMDFVTKAPSPTGTGKSIAWIRVLENGPNIYFLIAQSGPDKPLPPGTEAFFNSLRFDGKPAEKPAMAAGKPGMAKAARAAAKTVAKPAAPAAPALPAKRKLLGKIERNDRTADSALRTFLMAMEAGDEETLREITIPNDDFDWLLRGEMRNARELKDLKSQVIKARVERLKQGDRVRITPKEVHAINPTEVARDRAALKIEGAPAYAPMQLVKGHWKVDPAPIIAARKAAAGAR